MRCRRTRTAPTLARGHVARVATVLATSMKYSSQLGRIEAHYAAAKGASCRAAAAAFAVGHRQGGRAAEHAIPRVAQTRHDVSMFVQAFVEGARDDPNAGVAAHHVGDPIRR